MEVLDVVGRQSDGELAAVMCDGEPAVVAHCGDGPAVAVFDPVGGGQPEPAVVRAGDDHISDARRIAVGQTHLGRWWGVVEAMITGATVEFGDKLAGGGEHDRVEPSRSIGNPSVERILNCGGQVPDMNTAVIKVEVEASKGRLRGWRVTLPLRRGR